MNALFTIAICLLLATGFAAATTDEYGENSEWNKEVQSDENPRTVVEDYESETTALAQNDDGDTVALKNKGFCHFGVAVYYKPGVSVRCSCMKCTCKTGGKWDCAYNFAYCPYYYCGNQIYNPLSQICCCGKVHDKKADYSCCGYFYYYKKTSKCCNYYSVKPLKGACPRSKI